MKVSINELKNKVIVNETNNTVKVQIGGIQGPKGDDGDGITTINDLTELEQFIEIGEDGIDINIVSTGDTHTINIPTAFATRRGALSPEDWTVFYNKQDALGFVPENVANKATTFATINDTLYPSIKAVDDQLDLKVDKETGKGLSSNDYTNTEKTKLAGIEDGATQNETDAYLLDRTNHTGTQAISTIVGLQTALDNKADELDLQNHIDDLNNPHATTKAQVGLSNVDNTSDLSKPISTATQTALDGKVDKINITAGSLGSASKTPSIAYNTQGQITSASEQNIQIAQSQVNNLTTDLAGKEPTITAGTTSQYWRGDKTFQTLDTSAVAENTNLYFTEDRTRNTDLVGLSITGGSISSSDTILDAFGKVQNQINGVLGGAIYQGVWDATTNSPTLTSSVGTAGYYYIVNVAGSTNLDGITDWKIGDWAIFDGTAWQKVDNTDSVSSVNGQVGAVSLTTANISDSTDKRYVSDAQLVVLGNTSNTNTGDQTDATLPFTDIITNNASTLQHGFLPKLSGASSDYLNGQGNWAIPSGIVSTYTSVSFTAQTSVVVNHGFGVNPNVDIILSDGSVCIAPIQHTSVNSFTITFPTAQTGKAIASVGSPQNAGYVGVNSNYTTLPDDNIIQALTAGITITLEDATGKSGLFKTIKNASTGDITLLPLVGLLDIYASITLSTTESITFFSDGLIWRIS